MTYPKLDDLAALAIEAGREIMAVRAAGFDAMRKGDGSVVTVADQRAEAIVEAGLHRLAPDTPMIGEEAVAAGRIPEPGPLFFCVDPLDGTQGFARGGDEFTVNIALVERGAPIMGVVLSPATGELYAGEPGRALKALIDLGADEPPRFAAIAPKPKPAAGWRLVASRTKGRTHEAQAFAAALGAHTQDDCASSIKFCRLAEGGADLYPRFGALSEWDAAAGQAILAAVGGGVMDLRGRPLLYGRREAMFEIKGLIAYASDEAAAAAKAALAQLHLGA